MHIAHFEKKPKFVEESLGLGNHNCDRKCACSCLELCCLFQARSAQVPVIMAGKSVATTGTNYFNTAKMGVVNPQDQQSMYQMQQSAKGVADAMKRLITAIK